jgi:hypothetical protein
MGWKSTLGRPCLAPGCGKWHDIFYPDDEMPVMSHTYVFTCPTARTEVRFRPSMAAEQIATCPSNCVVVRPTGTGPGH